MPWCRLETKRESLEGLLLILADTKVFSKWFKLLLGDGMRWGLLASRLQCATIFK